MVSALIGCSVPTLEVVRLDLSDGNPMEVVNIPILRFYEFRDPVIAGSMVFIPLARNSAYEVLLVNWRDQTGIILGGFEGFSVCPPALLLWIAV